MMQEPSHQFVVIKDHERKAYKAFMAIWGNQRRHVVIAAPTLDTLEERWFEIVHVPLNSRDGTRSSDYQRWFRCSNLMNSRNRVKYRMDGTS